MSEPSVAPEHAAPPAYTPLSGGAVTALVLALLLAIPAMAGVWWLEVLPLLVVLLSWSAISGGRRRGRGLAIVAGALALTVGAWSYVSVRVTVAKLETDFDVLMTALDKGDRKELEGWIVKDAPADSLDRWVRDFATARGRAGPYAARVIVAPGIGGPIVSMLMPPSSVVDAVDAARPPLGFGRALWFQAVCQKQRLWVAGLLLPDGTDPSEADAKAAAGDLEGGGHVRFRDLRFYVESAPE